MKKRQLFVPIFVGLLAGQLFAEGDRSFKVVNTLRAGYDDNIERERNAEGSAFVEDMLDLFYHPNLSAQTDLVIKTRLKYASDEETNLNPNLYAVLTHNFSQRFGVQLSEKYRKDQVTSAVSSGRDDYFENTVSLTPSYVISNKDRLTAPVSYTVKRYNGAIVNRQDTDLVTAGMSWQHELAAQKTWMALNATQVMADYKKRNATYDATRLTAQLSHTFTPEWHGDVEVGASFDETDTQVAGVSTTSSGTNPFLRLGLDFTPSPRSRLRGDFTHRYRESGNSLYAGETTTSVRLGAEHDITAKILGKVSVLLEETEHDASDGSATADESESRFDLDCRLQYKVNRINFLELGFKHREKQFDQSPNDWEGNRIDVGWRIDL